MNYSEFGYRIINDLTKTEENIFQTIVFLVLILDFTITGIILILNIFSKSIRESCESYIILIISIYFISTISYFFGKLLPILSIPISYSPIICISIPIFPNFLTAYSQFNFLAIFVKRFILIRYPFKYNKFCSSSITIFFALVIFLSTLFVVLSPLFLPFGPKIACNELISLNDYNLSLMLYFAMIPFFPSFILYISILKIAKRHANSMESQTNSVKSISNSSKITFSKLCVTLVLWIIYAYLFQKSFKDMQNISNKNLSSLELVFFFIIAVNSSIIIFSNPKIKNTLNFRHFIKKSVIISPINS